MWKKGTQLMEIPFKSLCFSLFIDKGCFTIQYWNSPSFQQLLSVRHPTGKKNPIYRVYFDVWRWRKSKTTNNKMDFCGNSARASLCKSLSVKGGRGGPAGEKKICFRDRTCVSTTSPSSNFLTETSASLRRLQHTDSQRSATSPCTEEVNPVSLDKRLSWRGGSWWG